ncbi:restriction endonuclease [Vagococcus sp.]|uniref:restriction endonuclease n=1 Tax=Vagococcus sp. TaxID=1933889 RepID=UPI003F9D7FDA
MNKKELMATLEIPSTVFKELMEQGMPSKDNLGKEFNLEEVTNWRNEQSAPILNYFKLGKSYDNVTISDKFKCSIQSKIRRSHATNSLVLFLDHFDSPYHDYWRRGKLLFSGMGLNKDQKISKAPNKTLANSQKNKVEIHLFERLSQEETGQYIYSGRMELLNSPKRVKEGEHFIFRFKLKPVDM